MFSHGRNWTRVHRANEHKRRGISDGSLDAADADRSVLKRLTQTVKHFRRKFRDFVEEQNAVVGKRNLTRLRIGAASYKRHLRDGMVRTAERPWRSTRHPLKRETGSGKFRSFSFTGISVQPLQFQLLWLYCRRDIQCHLPELSRQELVRQEHRQRLTEYVRYWRPGRPQLE